MCDSCGEELVGGCFGQTSEGKILCAACLGLSDDPDETDVGPDYIVADPENTREKE